MTNPTLSSGPVITLSRNHRLLHPVMEQMFLRREISVMFGLQSMTLRQLRLMGGFLVIA